MSPQTRLPGIPDTEFAQRLAALKRKMKAQSLDLLVVYSNMLDPGHVRYLSDVCGINESCAMVIPLKGAPVVCSGQACQVWARHKSRVKDVRIFPEVGEVAGTEYLVGSQFSFDAFFRELAKKLRIRKIGTVGTLIFPQIIYAQLQAAFPKATFVNAEPLMFELRFVKSRNEIACIRKAAGLLDEAFAGTLSKLKPGWTELEIEAEITASLLRGGAEGTAAAWAPMIPSGPKHSQLCMNRNTLRQVKKGEIICLQAGAMYEGYNAALCTPVVLGRIPAGIRDAVLCANEAVEAILSVLKAGVTSREANAAGKAVLARGGFEKYSPYAMVHNVGLLECESPWMAADKDYAIPAGATVCLDAFLFGLPWGSFRIEETLAITARGVDRLTRFNKTFIAERYI
ncbi:MAG: Xaa-Pro peptidase family protein [Kiritimatiellae bacterium]|nr:Xaa-Pro peptidase family protein [Kiritimatiellia bacterium]